MEQRSVIGAEILVHHSLIDNDLLSLLAIGPVVVELEGLDELVLAVGIPFICLDNWHATLVRLNDVHREILYIVLIVFSYQITLHSNDFLFIRVLVVLVCVVLSRQIKELLSWILGASSHSIDVLLKSLDTCAASCILRSFVAKSQ
jgi:hypothetical protein